MNKSIFREKSLERVTSPDQLNDYIRVANPGVMVILLAVIFLLAGIIVWGIFGQIETTLSVAAITEDGVPCCYVREADIDKISPSMPVRIGETEYSIRTISRTPVQVNADFPDYLLHVGGLSEGEWVFPVTLNGTAGTEGDISEAQIVTESIPPMFFITN